MGVVRIAPVIPRLEAGAAAAGVLAVVLATVLHIEWQPNNSNQTVFATWPSNDELC